MEYSEILDRASNNRSLVQAGTIELHEALTSLTDEVGRSGRVGMMYAISNELQYRSRRHGNITRHDGMMKRHINGRAPTKKSLR